MWKNFKKILLWLTGIVLSIMILSTAALLVFHKKIENYALSQLNHFLKTEVYVFDMEITFWSTFPSVSIEFEKVLITDHKAIPNTKSDTLLFADKLNLNLNTAEFWKGNYKVKSIQLTDARVGLRVAENGYVNYNIIKSNGNNASQNFKFSLEDVLFNNLTLTYDNYRSGQHYAVFAKHLQFKGNFTQDLYDLAMTGNIVMKKIKSKSVVLLKNKKAAFNLSIQVNRKDSTFMLKPSKIQIEHLPFVLQANIKNNNIDLRLEAENIALTQLTSNILSKSVKKIKQLKGRGKVNFCLTVNGEIGGETQPLVVAEFNIQKGSLYEQTTHTALTSINLQGMYSNHQGKNEEIRINQFTFHSKYGDFSGKLAVTDFEKPVFKGKLTGGVDLGLLSQLLPVKSISNLSGNMQLNTWFHFKMNAPQFNPSDITIYEAKGNIELYGVNIDLIGKIPTINNLNGKIIVIKDKAAFNKISFTSGKSDVHFSGNIENITAYFANKSSLNFDAVVEANNLRSQDFYPKHNSSSYVIGRFILPQNINGNIDFKVKKLNLGAHIFSDIYTKASIRKGSFTCKNARFSHLETHVIGNISIHEKKPGDLLVLGDIQTNEIDLKKLFANWNNFDQQIITAKNISGKAQLHINYALPYSFRKGLIEDKIEAKIEMKINDGALKNVTAFKSITQNMRKNMLVKTVLNKHIDLFEQKLENLQFKTLENTFTISKGKIVIPEMKIRSNAINIDISGTHDFDNNVNYHLDFRFRDLKTTNHQTEFGEIIDDGTGIRLFLHLFGNMDNLQFEWDKAQKKANQKEKWQKEKQTIKSMLKSDLGLFKNDTTVKNFVAPEKPKDNIEFIFEDTKKEEENIKKEQKQKNGFFQKLKQQSEKEKEPQFEFEVVP